MGDLKAQLDAAHQAIDQLRSENAILFGAVRFTLEFHDDCICRAARRALIDAREYVVPSGASVPTRASSAAADANHKASSSSEPLL